MNFSLLYHHKMDIRIFEDMVPWERDIYVGMLIGEVEEENMKMQLAETAARAAGKKVVRR